MTTITIEDRLASLEPRVGEVEALVLASRRPRYAVTIEEARAILATPAEHDPEAMERLHRIYGTFDGPEDLSTRMRDYLSGERD